MLSGFRELVKVLRTSPGLLDHAVQDQDHHVRAEVGHSAVGRRGVGIGVAHRGIAHQHIGKPDLISNIRLPREDLWSGGAAIDQGELPRATEVGSAML